MLYFTKRQGCNLSGLSWLLSSKSYGLQQRASSSKQYWKKSKKFNKIQPSGFGINLYHLTVHTWVRVGSVHLTIFHLWRHRIVTFLIQSTVWCPPDYHRSCIVARQNPNMGGVGLRPMYTNKESQLLCCMIHIRRCLIGFDIFNDLFLPRIYSCGRWCFAR